MSGRRMDGEMITSTVFTGEATLLESNDIQDRCVIDQTLYIITPWRGEMELWGYNIEEDSNRRQLLGLMAALPASV